MTGMNSDVVPKCQNFYEEVIPSFNLSTFKSHFRITPTAFEFLYNSVVHLPEFMKREYGGKDQINTEKVLLIALWTLATPSSYRSIGNQFNVCKYSVFYMPTQSG
ncbi:hypothetical protein NQ314_007969 [Rhamnusium bicolor]|uniref:Transposase Helix-turn-helix domain-containing protein n=1 Tax=Rhamnusium bicolor TaxID=1586634 RepID=A0AAV8YGB8_9CUCU|nr:hypothetical protein NQ314_007969 [Rhamnusium bicolor]